MNTFFQKPQEPKGFEAFTDKYDLSLLSKFIPFSQSPNPSTPLPTLNHKVTLFTFDQHLITTHYARSLSYTIAAKVSTKTLEFEGLTRQEAIAIECEYGFCGTLLTPYPTLAEVLYDCLLIEAPRGPLYEQLFALASINPTFLKEASRVFDLY